MSAEMRLVNLQARRQVQKNNIFPGPGIEPIAGKAEPAYLPGPPDDPFRKQKSHRQVSIVARRPHGHGNGFLLPPPRRTVTDLDLNGFLNGQTIGPGRRDSRGKDLFNGNIYGAWMPGSTHNRMFRRFCNYG